MPGAPKKPRFQQKSHSASRMIMPDAIRETSGDRGQMPTPRWGISEGFLKEVAFKGGLER